MNDLGFRRVAALLVTYGDRSELCREAASRAAKSGCFATLVVTNGVQECVAALHNEWQCGDPSRRLVLHLKENVGSAVAIAEGLKALLASTDFEFVWILDDDNLVADDGLSKLLKCYSELSRRHEEPVLLGGRRIDRKTHSLVSRLPPQLVYPPHGSFLYFDIMRAARRLTQNSSVPADEVSEPVEVPYLPYGGLLLTRRAAAVQPRCDLILYEDDTEFTYRLGQLGFRLFVAPQVEVRDAEGSWADGAGGRSWVGPKRLLASRGDFRLFYAVRNRVFFDRVYCEGRTVRLVVNAVSYLLICGSLVRTAQELRNFHVIVRAARAGWRGSLGLSREYNLP